MKELKRKGAPFSLYTSATKTVAMNGFSVPGNPPFFDRIFILFWRLRGQKEFQGTGIGWATCKKILERLGERIWVDTQLERDSFYFA